MTPPEERAPIQFTLAIAHRLHDGTVIIDALRERKPRFIPRDVVAEFAQLLKGYGISELRGDQYAGGFHSDEWQRNNITFVPCERTTSENYLHALPMLLAGRARLIDSATLRSQLASLERRISSTGHETVSHPQTANAHDDCATAVCGALSMSSRPSYDRAYRGFVDAPAPQPSPKAPVSCDGDWWKSQPRAPTYANANDRLLELYRGLDLAFRFGGPIRGR